MEHFEEAFTTKNWIMRIYKVKKRSNRERINFYEKPKKWISLKKLSRLSNPENGEESNEEDSS